MGRVSNELQIEAFYALNIWPKQIFARNSTLPNGARLPAAVDRGRRGRGRGLAARRVATVRPCVGSEDCSIFIRGRFLDLIFRPWFS